MWYGGAWSAKAGLSLRFDMRMKCFTDEGIKRIFMKRVNRILLTLLIAIAATIFTEAQQAHVNLDWAPQKNRQNLVPFSASVNSPEVTDDHMVIFRVKAPDAHEILLSGSVLLGLKESKPVPFTERRRWHMDFESGSARTGNILL